MNNPFLLIKDRLSTPQEVDDSLRSPKTTVWLPRDTALSTWFAGEKAEQRAGLLDKIAIQQARAHMRERMCGYKFMTAYLRKYHSWIPLDQLLDLVLISAYQHRWLDSLAKSYDRKLLPYQNRPFD